MRLNLQPTDTPDRTRPTPRSILGLDFLFNLSDRTLRQP
jgi:hypothetical protein